MKPRLKRSLLTISASAGLFALGAARVLAAAGSPGGGSNSLQNPLNSSISSIPDLLLAILNIIVIIMIPIVIFFIVYSGFLFVTAQGNDSKLTEAKRSLLYAIIGGVLIIGAEAITAIIKNVVAEFQ